MEVLLVDPKVPVLLGEFLKHPAGGPESSLYFWESFSVTSRQGGGETAAHMALWGRFGVILKTRETKARRKLFRTIAVSHTQGYLVAEYRTQRSLFYHTP